MSDDIIKTCLNCKYYCSIMQDTNSNFHFHDYCAAWQSTIPAYITSDEDSIYDAIELKEAVCWCFEPCNKNGTNS